MNHDSNKVPGGQIAKRFRVARPTLIFDNFMNYFIKVGGVMVIASIAGIFLFILSQIIPLFYSPSVSYDQTIELNEKNIVGVGIDDWSELPMVITADGTIKFIDLTENSERGTFVLSPDFSEQDLKFSYVRYNQLAGEVYLGTDDGRFSVVKISYQPTYPPGRSSELQRVIVPELSNSPLLPIGTEGVAFEAFDYADADKIKLAAAIQNYDGETQLHALVLKQKQTLLGPGKLEIDARYDLSDLIIGEPKTVLVSGDGDFIFVPTTKGEIFVLARDTKGFEVRQVLVPFSDLSDKTIDSIEVLLGGVSLIVSSSDGTSRMFSIYHDSQLNQRVLGLTKEFPKLPSGPTLFSASLRNKGFLIGSEDFVSLRFATTNQVRWEERPDFKVELALLGGRYNKILLLDSRNNLHLYDLKDRHPEASWSSYFGAIHYEGRESPEYIWQSTGGSDAFEPKVSMVPLIVGTIKGTIYAMMFAIPIALLCAIFTSQFLPSKFRRTIKPCMEIMESVPTVVLGFLAALWLAPILSERVPSFLLICFAIPISALAMGYLVSMLPKRYKVYIKQGYEFLYYAPVLFLVSWIGWKLGPIVESIFFVSVDPSSGARVADFRLWITNDLGIPFEQRNALVVGFLMGFAVIPTIFTIAEDSMSNVPTAFKSASLALGASRWQTTMNIVVPTAAAGIFSALMIGFGRAVGETMIVLMATGNTPVMTLNIFEGMRTLSANIAVEGLTRRNALSLAISWCNATVRHDFSGKYPGRGSKATLTRKIQSC